MHQSVRQAAFVGILLLVPRLGEAQERKYPVLNSLGRFLGVGYTQGGYHAGADGRFPIIKNRHPASSYPSTQLSYPYHAHYRHSLPHLGHARPSAGSPTLAPQPPAMSDTPSAPPKPAGPAPQWLKPYLRDQAPPRPELVPPPDPNSTSSPFRFENEGGISPSDQPSEEDDLLLLEPDDLSILHSAPAAPARANRYKQALSGMRPAVQ